VRPLRALLIEDNPHDRRLLAEALAEATGDKVVLRSAARLGDGLQDLREEPADVVLLDLKLPDSAGLLTLERFRTASPGTPVVVLTGSDDLDLAEEALREGAQDFLVKGRSGGHGVYRSMRYAILRAEMEQARAQAQERLQEIEDLRRGEREREIGRLRERDEFRNRLVGMASHEFKTPLTAQRLWLDLLLHPSTGPLNERQRRAVEGLDRGVRGLQRLVDDMLDVARLQSGRLALEPVPVDLGEVVADAAEALAESARRAGVRTVFELAPGLQVVADPWRVGQVVQNLLSNAIKFSPPGGSVAVRLARGGEGAVLEVEDRGAGLTPEQAGLLFQPFQQMHRASHPGQGTGLGLFITKGIVEQHGGTIQAASRGPGQGTTFRVWLPSAGPAAAGGPVADHPR
jgi:signal transduction histidine kinase